MSEGLGLTFEVSQSPKALEAFKIASQLSLKSMRQQFRYTWASCALDPTRTMADARAF